VNTPDPQQLNLLFGRRSVRVYSPGEVPDEIVNVLLRAAMAAPSAMTKDPWRFTVVRDPNSLKNLAQALPGGKMLATAALAIMVCGDQDQAFERQLSYLLQDCAAATQNLLLAAHGLGLGGCWVGVHPSVDAGQRLKSLFGFPSQFVPVAVVSLGWPGEELPSRSRFSPEYVRQEKW